MKCTQSNWFSIGAWVLIKKIPFMEEVNILPLLKKSATEKGFGVVIY